MSDTEVTVPASLDELRAWFHENKSTPECVLAMKHKANMDPVVIAELKSRAPGDSDEEKELAFIFSLTQIAEKLDMLSLLTAGLRVEHLPPVSPPVKVSHVDVVPLESEHLDEIDHKTK